MRIRIALSAGALLLAGGAVLGTSMAFAQPAPTPPPTVSAPTKAPQPAPAEATAPRPGTPAAGQKPSVLTPAPTAPRVPKAVPAGPTGDLHLPAITEGQ